MVRKPMIVDDSSNDDVDDDDLDLAEGAAAGGQATTGGEGANTAGDGDAPQKEKKSVRLAAAGGHMSVGAQQRCQRGSLTLQRFIGATACCSFCSNSASLTKCNSKPDQRGQADTSALLLQTMMVMKMARRKRRSPAVAAARSRARQPPARRSHPSLALQPSRRRSTSSCSVGWTPSTSTHFCLCSSCFH